MIRAVAQFIGAMMFRLSAPPLQFVGWLAAKWDRLAWHVYWFGAPAADKKLANDLRALIELGIYHPPSASSPAAPALPKVFVSGGHPGDGMLQ